MMDFKIRYDGQHVMALNQRYSNEG